MLFRSRLAHGQERCLPVSPGNERGEFPSSQAVCTVVPAPVVRRAPEIVRYPPRGDAPGGRGREPPPPPRCNPFPLLVPPGPVRTAPSLLRGIGRGGRTRGPAAAGAHLPEVVVSNPADREYRKRTCNRRGPSGKWPPGASPSSSARRISPGTFLIYLRDAGEECPRPVARPGTPLALPHEALRFPPVRHRCPAGTNRSKKGATGCSSASSLPPSRG